MTFVQASRSKIPAHFIDITKCACAAAIIQ